MHFVGCITSKLHRRCLELLVENLELMLYEARFITKRPTPVCNDSAVKYQTDFGAFNFTIDTGMVSSRYCDPGDAVYL